MDKHLRIILELVTRGFAGGVRNAQGIFKGFVGGITNGAVSASRALVDMARAVFFVREALTTLAQVGRWVFDTFIKGAGDAAKLEAKLKAITGSADDAARVMGLLRQTAADTGADFDELAAGAGLMAVAAKDASGAFDFGKFQRLMNMLQRMAALRPDVPLDRLARGLSAAVQGDWSSLEMFLDVQLRQLIGLKDAADDVTDIPGEVGRAVTYIETAAGDAAKSALQDLDLLDEALTKAGATAEIIGDVAELSGLERFQQILAQIAATVGEPLFVVLNEELSKLADWLQENPDKVEEFATLIGETLAGAMEDLFEALENIDWSELGDTLERIGAAMQTISQAGANFSKFVDDYNRWNTAIFAPERLGEVPGGAELAAAGGLGGAGQAIRQAASSAVNQLPGVGPGRLIVEILLKDELLDARVRQTADNAVADGFNIVAEEMSGGGAQP